MLPQPATGRQPAFLAALLVAIVSVRRPNHRALVLAGVARGVRLGVEGGKDVERGVPVEAAAVAEVVPTPAAWRTAAEATSALMSRLVKPRAA